MIECFYALGGINYKNGVITTCPRQANQLVFAHETIKPSELFNHENFKEVRRMLYNDQWPSGCDTCEDMEKVGAKSMRLDYIPIKGIFSKNTLGNGKKYSSKEFSPIPLLQCYDKDTHKVSNEGLRHVELRFSTACNFACLHCSEVYSSGWSKKIQNYIPDEETKLYELRQLLGTEHRHGPNDKNEMSLTTKQALMIIDDLNENFPYLEYVDFAGGEVLYQKQFFPVLRKLSEHPNANKIHVSFHTNFNADFDTKLLAEILLPFKSASLMISVDAGKSYYSYFRHGGQWDKLLENIKTFKQYKKELGASKKFYMDTSITTSIYQMLDLPDTIESFFELGCKFDASIVQTPKYLNPSIIMYDFSEYVYDDFKKVYDMIEKYDPKQTVRAKYWVDYIYEYVTKTKINYKYFNQFLIYRKKSDEIWQQNFNDYFQHYQIEDNELIRI